MAGKPPLAQAEVLRVLGALQPLAEDRSIVLVGGQAVVFWTMFLQARSPELAALAPPASKDIDFEGDAHSAQHAADLLGGRVRLAAMDDNTPNTGLVLFVDAGGVEREIDFIDQPLGLNADDVRDSAVQLVLPAERDEKVVVWLMHPERCMESRIYNAQVLQKTDPVAIRQLQASIVCAREWSRYLLDQGSSPERVRAVLRVNERIFRRCATDFHFKRLVKDLAIDPFAAVLADHDALPNPFTQTRYPQMLAQLGKVREQAQLAPGAPGDDPLALAEHGDVGESIEARPYERADAFALDDDLDIDR
jgi:hypothetical protein